MKGNDDADMRKKPYKTFLGGAYKSDKRKKKKYKIQSGGTLDKIISKIYSPGFCLSQKSE